MEIGSGDCKFLEGKSVLRISRGPTKSNGKALGNKTTAIRRWAGRLEVEVEVDIVVVVVKISSLWLRAGFDSVPSRGGRCYALLGTARLECGP
jgi:hypothetical protein